MQRALYDPVDPALLGSLAADLQYRVNGEVYRFGQDRTLHTFVQEPELWCGLLRDRVSGLRFVPSARSPRVYFVGGPYYFASDSTRDRFLEDPGKFEVKRAM